MRSEWVDNDFFKHILAALTPPNRLAITVSLVTGLRINDVLTLKASQLQKCRFTVTEMKTLKKRNIRLPVWLRDQLLDQAGRIFVFEHRTDPRKPRTRQAVYKDIKRAAKAFRCRVNISPHSARKAYAVNEFRKDMDLRRVQRLLNHSDEAVTMVYALADELTERKKRG